MLIVVGQEIVVTFEKARTGRGVVACCCGSVFFPRRDEWRDFPPAKPGETWKVRIVYRSDPPHQDVYHVAPVEHLDKKAAPEGRQGGQRFVDAKRDNIAPPQSPFPVRFVRGRTKPIAYYGGMLCIPSSDWTMTHGMPHGDEIYMVRVGDVRRRSSDKSACWFLLPVDRIGRWPREWVDTEAQFDDDRIRVVEFLRPRNWEHPYSAVANLDGLPAYPHRDHWFCQQPYEGEIWLVRVAERLDDQVFISGVARAFDRTFVAQFGEPDRSYPEVSGS
ncbi:MAG TPA: hypothetical protein PLP17_10595 [Oligoflexia bacterium]|nr:hypothetical protein [Oligoflexia bacterium]